jgi:hypothetical protein
VSPVWCSQHDDAGVITGWQVAGEFPDAPWTASAFVVNDRVFIVGDGSFSSMPNPFLDRVHQAQLYPDGGLGPFRLVLPPLLRPRAHVHQTPEHRGFVYSVGGRDLDSAGNIISLRRVDIGKLVQP